MSCTLLCLDSRCLRDFAVLHHLILPETRRKGLHGMQALYQLQRGPMLGSPGSHPEEKSLLQALFTNAAIPVAVRMLAPALLLLDRGSGQFNAVTPASIALWSGTDLPSVNNSGTPGYIQCNPY